MALVVGASEMAENPLVIDDPLLVEGRYIASIPFLCEYFTNGKNAEAAQSVVENGRKHAHLMLGAARIAQEVERNCGLSTTVMFSYSRSTRPQFEAAVSSSKILLLSTTLTATWQFAEKIALHAKLVNPSIIVIAGGMRVFKSYKLYLKEKEIDNFELNDTLLFSAEPFNSAVDYLIVSLYGERTVAKLINSLLKNDGQWRKLPNVSWYQRNIGNFTIPTILEEEPNDCEVDWSRIPVPPFPVPWYPVQVGQGCPFKCSFCDYAAVAPKVTRCSPESIFRTISSIPPWKDGLRRVLFTNDNLLISRTVAKEFLTELIKRDLHVVWKAFVRADTVQDEEIADLMQKSGCRLVFIGVESCEQTVLSNMSKHTTVEMIRRCVLLLLERSVLVRAALVVGFPGETRETVEATMNFFNNLPVVGALEVQPVTLVLSPLSPLSEPAQREQFGVTGMWSNWLHRTMSSIEADVFLSRMPSMLLPHLSVPYETDSIIEDVASVSSDARRNVYRIRNLLHKHQQQLSTTSTTATTISSVDPIETQLWNDLEAAVLAMITSTTSPSILPPENSRPQPIPSTTSTSNATATTIAANSNATPTVTPAPSSVSIPASSQESSATQGANVSVPTQQATGGDIQQPTTVTTTKVE
ncbi:radical SAM protein [Pelomyxa schiedti]|nr:radical SAM protein [Pelomyxa schiedti]